MKPMNKEQDKQTEELRDETGEQEATTTEEVGEGESIEASEEMEAELAEEEDSSLNELAEYKDKFVRLYAEFENFRKRTNKEKLELLSTANGALIKDLLPVVDDFERAMTNNEKVEDPAALKEGFLLIFNKFRSILESKGLKPMEVKGQSFDPELQEAIANIPAPTEELKGKVVDDVEKGYYLNDKVIRFAKVVVGQ